jgi:hypothetical protein
MADKSIWPTAFLPVARHHLVGGGRHLDYSSASHYIINYQKKAGNRFFRMEAYYKTYKGLINTYPSYSNNGNGYARGVELFWRDKRTLRTLITGSRTYLDTKRKWMDFPYAIAPSFYVHTLSLVVKKYFRDINLSANMAYTASGRPYYDIQQNASGALFSTTRVRRPFTTCDESEFRLPVFNISKMEE